MVNCGNKYFRNVKINLFRIKRGLQQSSLVLTRSVADRIWEKATFCIFDTPDSVSKTYEERISFIRNFAQINKWPDFLHVIEPIKCLNRDHLKNFLQNIVQQKGEGAHH